MMGHGVRHARMRNSPTGKRGIEKGGAYAPMSRMYLRALALASVLAVSATMAIAAERYVAPGGAFSIALTDPAAPAFRSGRETVSNELIAAEFPFLDSSGLALASGRTVEWIRLEKPIDPSQYDGQATALAEGYLEGRYGAGAFALAGSGKFRSADGRLVYVFAAQGTFDGRPARWQGCVQFFDAAVALVGEVAPGGARQDETRGIVSQPAVDWALTLRPGP